MSTKTSDVIQVEMTYTDYTTRNYKIPSKTGFTQEGMDAAKAGIRAFNAAASSASSATAQTFLSATGAPVGSITDATLIHTEEEEIYHA